METVQNESRRNFLKFAGIGASAAALSPSLIAAEFDSQSIQTPYRVGEWLASDKMFLAKWLDNQIQKAESSNEPLHPTVQELKWLIEEDPQIYMYFTQMFEQIPNTKTYAKTPMGTPQVRSYDQALKLISAVLRTAPEYNKTGLVGFPINAILDWAMGTQAGAAVFLNEKVNAQFKKILNEWGRFLSSPDSTYVLSNDPKSGWFGADAQKAMPNFAKDFKCDPSLPYYGFKSWDDFFIREFKDGIRPVASPNDDSIIVNACESAPFKVARNVKKRDTFWIKSQPYSLEHMLANDKFTDKFVGGTIYQAFLSALSYHRWHSPINGTVVKAYIKEGSYYAQALSEGFDPASPNNSQAYITEVATRAIMFIEADNPKIGLICIMQVGMAEVSTCEITVKEGQKVKKGEQLGMFHFGGSTYCLMLRPEVKVNFDLRGQKPSVNTYNIPVNSMLAKVY
ncbi:MAG: hypothetical protein RL154_1667 [Pseudomonadota bacterium]